jgi:hypothetical protein
MFTIASIKAGERIVGVPNDLTIMGTQCEVIEKLRAEMMLGRCSKFWPYLKVLQEHEIAIPNVWPPDELKLLDNLPPYDWTRHTAWWTSECQGNLSDPIGLRALLAMVARSSIEGFVPVYDTFNHRAGWWHNTAAEWRSNYGMEMFTTRDVNAGEQLYHHYGKGGGAIFRDYGFVEQDPVIWEFENGDQHFEVEETGGGRITLSPSAQSSSAFEEMAKNLLEELAESDPQRSAMYPAMPAAEHTPIFRMARVYRQALTSVLTSAIHEKGDKTEL